MGLRWCLAGHRAIYFLLRRYTRAILHKRCIAYTMGRMFDWDRHNLKKIKAHGLEPVDVEHALTSSPILFTSRMLTAKRDGSTTAKRQSFGCWPSS